MRSRFFFVLLICLLTSRLIADKLKLESMVTDKVLAYWTLDNLTELKQQAQAHPSLKVFYEPWFQSFLQDPIQKFDTEFYSTVEPTIGLTLEELFSIPSGQISFVFHDFTMKPGENPGPEHIAASIVLEFDENYHGKVLELIEKLVRFIEKNLREAGEELVLNELSLYGGKLVEFNFMQGDGTPRTEKMYYGLNKNYFIIGLQNKDALENMMMAISGQTLSDSLAQSELGRDFLSVHPKESFTRGFVNLKRAYELLLVLAENQAAVIETFAPMLGLNKFNSLSFSMGLKNELFETFFYISCPGPKQGILKLFDVKMGKLAPSNSVPSSVLSYFTCYYSLMELYHESLRILGEIDQSALAAVEDGLQQFKQETQLDVEQDILASFGERFSMVVYSTLSKDLPEMVLIMELANLEKFNRAKDLLFQLIALGSNLNQEDYLGKTIWSLSEEILPQLSLSYMIDGNDFCFGFTKEALKKYIRGLKDQSAPLNESTSYQKLQPYHLPKAGMLMFSNVLDAENWAEMLAAEDTRSQMEFFGLQFEKFPTYEQVRPYLTHSVTTYRSDERGFLLKSVAIPQK